MEEFLKKLPFLLSCEGLTVMLGSATEIRDACLRVHEALLFKGHTHVWYGELPHGAFKHLESLKGQTHIYVLECANGLSADESARLADAARVLRTQMFLGVRTLAGQQHGRCDPVNCSAIYRIANAAISIRDGRLLKCRSPIPIPFLDGHTEDEPEPSDAAVSIAHLEALCGEPLCQ